MIVVVGRLPVSAALPIARAAAARGGRVELVATVPSDAVGDRLLLTLSRAGVGHAAVMRTPAPELELEPADLELALRYLPDARVIVLAGPTSLADTASAAAAWSDATLVLVTAAGAPPPVIGSGDRRLVVASPARDPDGAVAGLIADLAVRLDAGQDLESAWQATREALLVEPVSVGSAAGKPAAHPEAQPAANSPPAAPRGSGRRSGRR